MAFHVDCPFTARMVCTCRLYGPGGEGARREYLQAAREVWAALHAPEEVLKEETVELLLPRPQPFSHLKNKDGGWTAADVEALLGPQADAGLQGAQLRELLGLGAEDGERKKVTLRQLQHMVQDARKKSKDLEARARKLAGAAGLTYPEGKPIKAAPPKPDSAKGEGGAPTAQPADKPPS